LRGRNDDVPEDVIEKLVQMSTYLDQLDTKDKQRDRILQMREYCVSHTKDWEKDDISNQYSAKERRALESRRNFETLKNYRVQDLDWGMVHGMSIVISVCTY
jgi:hypothetical protein